jgi:hypothetical protein
MLGLALNAFFFYERCIVASNIHTGIVQEYQAFIPLHIPLSLSPALSISISFAVSTLQRKSHLQYVFLFWELRGLSPNRFIYSQDRSTYFPAAD